jgi:hypothetical protein
MVHVELGRHVPDRAVHPAYSRTELDKVMARGRKPGIKIPEEHRLKIQVGNIINRLCKIATGEVEGSAVQVTAALGLLRKVMPDLSSQQLTGDKDNPVHQVSRIERDIIDPMPAPSPTEVANLH